MVERGVVNAVNMTGTHIAQRKCVSTSKVCYYILYKDIYLVRVIALHLICIPCRQTLSAEAVEHND